MRRARPRREPNEMLPEYDFSGGVRGKYAARFTTDTIMVVLDPDVADAVRKRSKQRSSSIGSVVNDLLRRDIRQTHRMKTTRRAPGMTKSA